VPHSERGRSHIENCCFGNPLLDGGGEDTARAEEARRRQQCNPRTRPHGGYRSAAARNLGAPSGMIFSGTMADPAALRRQTPLPETAGELCAVARSAGAKSALWLGSRMTEGAIKSLSAKGELRDYRVLHFATHGLVAGDLNGAEPSLMFTPPQTPTEEDDGLLTASEAAQLNIDADWVVMSACNTAAGEAEDAEALAGLTRAFFYAGARSLLVSHWAVDSDAAVEITTAAFAAMKTDPKVGQAEALRRAVKALIAKGGAAAHPAVWAPFVAPSRERQLPRPFPPEVLQAANCRFRPAMNDGHDKPQSRIGSGSRDQWTLLAWRAGPCTAMGAARAGGVVQSE
jgi:hypothetical protein